MSGHRKIMVAPNSKQRMLIRAEGDLISGTFDTFNFGFLTNLHFSGSGLAKFSLYLNGELLAILFNGHQNYNCDYLHSVKFYANDIIEVELENRENVVQDLCVGWKLE
jgi:hypothetical protein